MRNLDVRKGRRYIKNQPRGEAKLIRNHAIRKLELVFRAKSGLLGVCVLDEETNFSLTAVTRLAF
jgi:hypothetical protein